MGQIANRAPYVLVQVQTKNFRKWNRINLDPDTKVTCGIRTSRFSDCTYWNPKKIRDKTTNRTNFVS